MHNEKILVIEDSESLVYVLGKFLKEIGYRTIYAYNGTDGIKSAITENVCLAIVDIGLPDISGLKVIDRIKDINPKLPIIVISKLKDIVNNLLT